MPGRPVLPETWERQTGAACTPLGEYHRREPEQTLFHQVVRERLEPFLASIRERSTHGHGLPAFVERERRAYLDCGILARGLARVRCPDCGFERLVAFSCKAHVCPSCNARRMEDTADLWVVNTRSALKPMTIRPGPWILAGSMLRLVVALPPTLRAGTSPADLATRSSLSVST